GADPGISLRVERSGSDHVVGENDLEVERIPLPQLLGHLAADQDAVGLAAELSQDAELVLDLRASGDEHKRPLDVPEKPAELLQFMLEQQARVGPQEFRDGDCGGMCAVNRAK